MGKVETTTKELRVGVKLASGDELRWESTGYISVRLLDSSGTVPLARRAVNFQVPKEGTIEQESDDQGKIFYPDVPFQDYELDLGDGFKVHVAAVANKDEVHDRYVFEVEYAFANLQVREEDGSPIGPGKLTLSSPDQEIAKQVDKEGIVETGEHVPVGDYEVIVKTESRTFRGTIKLDNRLQQLMIATLTEESA